MTRTDSIARLTEFLQDLNRRHSKAFCSTDAQMERRRYRARHPTKIVAMQCSDGRIHIACATKTPLGIIQSVRNIGGEFRLGWPQLDEVLYQSFLRHVDQGQRCLVLVTYHYSASNPCSGCAGVNFNTKRAIRLATVFKQQLEDTYGRSHEVICPIICGFETDRGALVFHGDGGEVIDLSRLNPCSTEDLKLMLKSAYPSMPLEVLNDLLPLAVRNLEHIAEVKAKNRPVEAVQHKESILAVGRGFDWLYEPNRAIIVGPYNPNINEPIRKAARIIRSNLLEGRISQDGFLLLASAIHTSDAGVEIARAKLRALEMRDVAVAVIRRCCPDVAKLMHPMAVVTSLDTRRFREVTEG